MIDPTRLYRQLELSNFTQRAQLADEVAGAASAEEVAALIDGLASVHPGVRLGVIEIVRCARHRAGVGRLVAHAHAHAGDDRVFALRALVELARPGDAGVAALASTFVAAADPFVAAQAQRLVAALAGGAADRAEPASLDRLVAQLFAATRGADRIAGVLAIEGRGPVALFATARLVLSKGSADLVALVCRALIRQAAVMPEPAALVPLVTGARRRLIDAPVAVAALDDALLALGGLAQAPALLQRVTELAPAQVDALIARLLTLPAAEVALHVPPMLDALAQRPAMWSSLGPALAYAAAELRDSPRVELRRCTDGVIAALRAGRALPPVTLVSATRVLAGIALAGEALPTHLRGALERLPAAEAGAALAALCQRLATEEAAAVVIAQAHDPLPAVRAAARAVLASWRSPWVAIAGDDPWRIEPRYVDADGQALVRTGQRLVRAGGDDDHVLDERGGPIAARTAPLGGCQCCAPPRALVRVRGHGLRCPASWTSYLRDGDRSSREDDHPLGRCRRCDGIRPRTRDDGRVICPDCGDGAAPRASTAARDPEPGAPTSAVAKLPAPPTVTELEHVAPAIRAAMCANVFLQVHDGTGSWNASGIVIARDGDHIAILTNRHVVESDDDPQRDCRLEAVTVAGQARGLCVFWRAGRGIDLALIEGRVGDADRLGVMALGTGAVPVGAGVFTIGNPLGLAWTYSAGTLSAVRTWTTSAGQDVRVLQTDASTAPGSSGGGLWHADGHLLGVMSFLRQADYGGSAHFALSIDAIRGALARDAVRWRGTTFPP